MNFQNAFFSLNQKFFPSFIVPLHTTAITRDLFSSQNAEKTTCGKFVIKTNTNGQILLETRTNSNPFNA